MTCESCIKDISGSLFKLSGIQKVEANLKDQLVTVEGTGSSHLFHACHSFGIEPGPDCAILAAPSAIVAAIQSTGRDAILRGTGGSNSGFPASLHHVVFFLIKSIRCGGLHS